MGRHRNDPRGANRVLIAVFAIVLLVVLVAAGSFALYGALTADPQPTSTSAASAAPTSVSGTEPVRAGQLLGLRGAPL